MEGEGDQHCVGKREMAKLEATGLERMASLFQHWADYFVRRNVKIMKRREKEIYHPV